MKLDDAVATETHLRMPRPVKYTQLQISSPETMRFTRDVFERGMRPLLSEPRLCSPDPVDSCANRTLDIASGRPGRRRHPHVTVPVHADREISNAFVCDGRVDAGCGELVLPQRKESLCEAHRSAQ